MLRKQLDRMDWETAEPKAQLYEKPPLNSEGPFLHRWLRMQHKQVHHPSIWSFSQQDIEKMRKAPH